MTKVYVLHEYDDIRAVFSNKEAAERTSEACDGEAWVTELDLYDKEIEPVLTYWMAWWAPWWPEGADISVRKMIRWPWDQAVEFGPREDTGGGVCANAPTRADAMRLVADALKGRGK